MITVARSIMRLLLQAPLRQGHGCHQLRETSLKSLGYRMGGRSGFEGFLRASIRAAAAFERERQRPIRMQLSHARQFERQARMAASQHAREERTAQKLAKAQYLEDRQGEVDDLNAELMDRLEELQGLLPHTLVRDDRINFDDLRQSTPFETFKTPACAGMTVEAWVIRGFIQR